jgi:uncharacterized protein (DUF1330 family)
VENSLANQYRMAHTPGFVNYSLHRHVSGCLFTLRGSVVPKAYWIARIQVNDPEAYKNYVAGAAAAFRDHGAEFLVRGGRFEAAEGAARRRNIIIEFPSYRAAVDCYHSPIYQAARAHRAAAAIGEIVSVEGVDV